MTGQDESLAMIQRLARGELSLRVRLGYVALLLVATAMSVVILALWITEPALPMRTQVAFGAMSVIGLSWVGFALWAVTTRRVLFARDRVIAGHLAVAFTSMFLAGSVALAVVQPAAAAFGMAGTGVLMLSAALAVLAGARRRFAELAARRAQLERASN